MPSPFPGMDPYLESAALWPDLHAGLNAALRAELNARLPPGFAARMDRFVWIHEPEAEERKLLGKPDVYVAEPAPGAPRPGQGGMITAPTVVTLPVVRREGGRYVKIIDLQRHRVVTVIETLSPSNKEPGEDREAYLAKRNEYLASGTNLVEIDLLRVGERLPLGEPTPPAADYYILVSQAAEFPRAGVWAFSVRDPLPEIPVPLNPGDQPVPLPLKPCLDRAYDEGRYHLEINYAEPPRPPLPEPEADWARQMLSNHQAASR